MLVIHGAWVDGRLALWGEDPTLAPAAASRARHRPHPFAATTTTLTAALTGDTDNPTTGSPGAGSPATGRPRTENAAKAGSGDEADPPVAIETMGQLAARAEPGSLTLQLPSTARAPLASPEAGGAAQPARRRLAGWVVPTLLLWPRDALRLLDRLAELGPATPAASLRYLGVVAAHTHDLVRRGRLLPQLVTEEDGYAARWRPVLTGADAGTFRTLAAAMPPVCRATGADGAGVDGAGQPAARVLREAITALVDAAARQAMPERLLLGHRPGPRAALADRWMLALTADDPSLPGARPEEAQALGSALRAWLAAAYEASGPIRVCFRLVEPPPGDDTWQLDFALQSADDLSLYVPAEVIWAGHRVPGLTGRPDETLLAGLGRAVRLFPALHEALLTAQPAGMTLDTGAAHEFLRQAAPLLQAAGYGVRLPVWAGRKAIGLKLTTRSRSGPGAAADSGFGLAQLVDFRIDLAVGDELVDTDELAELARLKVPLVRVRGQWVELDDRQLKAAIKMVGQRREGQLTLGEVLAEVADGGEEDLPLVEVDADGLLGDLLSGEADQRLAPVPTPADFVGTLRPYQERGLSWLAFLSQLGLGGILADDMGLGKCILPGSPVVVEGTVMAAEEIWRQHAGDVASDGEGEW
ncbi:MAG TPA: SNF2 helicase-associated domain-containing protein, partial [Catenuloplanes sp.]